MYVLSGGMHTVGHLDQEDHLFLLKHIIIRRY